MNTKTQTASSPHLDAAYEISSFALGVAMTMASLVGVWGVTCLTSAMSTIGPLDVVKGYLTAIIG